MKLSGLSDSRKLQIKKLRGGGIKFVHGFANISPLQSVEE